MQSGLLEGGKKGTGVGANTVSCGLCVFFWDFVDVCNLYNYYLLCIYIYNVYICIYIYSIFLYSHAFWGVNKLGQSLNHRGLRHVFVRNWWQLRIGLDILPACTSDQLYHHLLVLGPNIAVTARLLSDN